MGAKFNDKKTNFAALLRKTHLTEGMLLPWLEKDIVAAEMIP